MQVIVWVYVNIQFYIDKPSELGAGHWNVQQQHDTCRTSLYLEVCEGDGPAVGVLRAGQQQGAKTLQVADVEAVVGGGGRSVHFTDVEHGLFGGVVKQRDTVDRKPPLTWRLIEGVGQLQSGTRGERQSKF